VARMGDRIITHHTRRCVGFSLDLTTELPCAEDRQLVPDAVWGDHSATLDGDYSVERRAPIDVLRVVRPDAAIAVELSGRHAPSCVAIGDGWIAWASGNKLFVRRDDGTVVEPKTGGRVIALASSGDSLAAIISAKRSQLLEIRP